MWRRWGVLAWISSLMGRDGRRVDGPALKTGLYCWDGIISASSPWATCCVSVQLGFAFLFPVNWQQAATGPALFVLREIPVDYNWLPLVCMEGIVSSQQLVRPFLRRWRWQQTSKKGRGAKMRGRKRKKERREEKEGGGRAGGEGKRRGEDKRNNSSLPTPGQPAPRPAAPYAYRMV